MFWDLAKCDWVGVVLVLGWSVSLILALEWGVSAFVPSPVLSHRLAFFN